MFTPLWLSRCLVCSFFRYSSTHSKASFVWNSEDVFYLHYSKISGGFRVFF